MKQYLDIVQRILTEGTEKLPERKLEGGRKLENSTIGLPNLVFSHNMCDGFPLLTTKKIPLRILAVELEGFLKGITDKKWYKERGCNIWNEWANPEAVEAFYNKNYKIPYLADKVREKNTLFIESIEPPPLETIRQHLQLSVDDLGPIYGYQWRHFGEFYGEMDGPEHNAYYDCCEQKASPEGTDQVQNILDTLTHNKNDRRMVCSAWNPNQLHIMALPPCHLMWIVTVYDNKLNLNWTQRSIDVALGLPFNIASYALLLLLLSKHAGLEPGNLTGNLIDCHIYENQIEGMKVQLAREPRKLPTVEIPNNRGNSFEFFKWDHTQIKISDYNPHLPIKMAVTV